MGTMPWNKIALKGESQVIPKVCPSCLAAGDHDYRIAYRLPMPLYLLQRTTYFQTFRYCEGCSRTLNAWLGYRRALSRLFFFALMLLIGTLILCAALVGHNKKDGDAFPTVRPMIEKIGEPVFFILMLGTALGLVIGLWVWAKKRAFAKAPLDARQAAWGPAAYYVGKTFLDIGSKRSYKALRPEWIKCLVAANPDQVDEDTYRRIVGEAKPSGPAPRPFA